MASVTGLTAARMLEIEAACIVDGGVVVNNLILTRQDGSTIDAGSVRGPTGSPGMTSGEFATAMNDNMPIGTIVDYIGSVSPSASWLTMVGQTVTNAQTLYPTWWSRIPASMKSGSSAIMPNTQGKVAVGLNSSDTDFDTIGEVGGTKTQTLTQAQLPAVGIAVDPPATTVSVNPPATTMSIDPPNTGVTGSTGTESAFHHHNVLDLNGQHGLAQIVQEYGSGGTTNWGISSQFGGTPNVTDGQSVLHTHTAGSLAVDIPAFNAVCDISPFNITVDIASFTSGNLGSGAAFSIVQPYVVFLKLVKVL